MISDAQITMLRLLSKDVAIAVDRAVKAKMQEQRISQGQLLLQTTRVLCSLQSQEQVIEAACQCACQLMDADEVVFVDCSSLHAQLYNPVEIGDASTRGQVFQALVWQKMKTEDDGSAAVDVKDDGDATNVDSDGDVDDGDAQEEAGDSGDTSARPRPAAAANFIRSIFNRAPPSPASLRDAWYCCCDDVMYCVNRHMSHVTRHTSHVTRHTSHVTRHTRSGFRAPATGGGSKHAAAAAAAWSSSQKSIKQLPRLFLSREHSLAQACAPLVL